MEHTAGSKIRQIAAETLRNERLVDALRDALAQAESGEIVGMLVCFETRNEGYEYVRINCPIQTAIGLASRYVYRLNQEWDEV